MQPTALDATVLRAIVIGHDRGGSDETELRAAVDFFERIGLTEQELRKSLARLRGHGAVRTAGGRHSLSSVAAAALPRTPTGQPSFAKRRWVAFVMRWAGYREPDA